MNLNQHVESFHALLAIGFELLVIAQLALQEIKMSVFDNSIYEEHGFKDRKEYLENLCEEYPEDVVMAVSSLLGRSEDFDGLLSTLENL